MSILKTLVLFLLLSSNNAFALTIVNDAMRAINIKVTEDLDSQNHASAPGVVYFNQCDGPSRYQGVLNFSQQYQYTGGDKPVCVGFDYVYGPTPHGASIKGILDSSSCEIHLFVQENQSPNMSARGCQFVTPKKDTVGGLPTQNE